ncbi:MAG: hypothetical protein ACLUN5_00200 [Oscillospiraceae bacterium]
MATNNWLQISTKLSTDPELVGKTITKVLAGFEKMMPRLARISPSISMMWRFLSRQIRRSKIWPIM